MVLNIGRLRSWYLEEVGEEVGAVAALAHKHQARLKLIFENSYLSLDQKIQACAICNQTGVDFAKTSTGFGSGGAEDGDLKLMRQYCRNDIGIKAAGGVRSLERLLAVRELGCTRVGATATATILEQARAASA